MNGLESRIKGLEEHIEKLYKTIEGWEKLARDKDEILKKYEQQVKNTVGLGGVSMSVKCDCCKSNKSTICDKCNSDMCVSAAGHN